MELKCYEYFYCDKSCFLECNDMYVNKLRLKSIQDKIDEYINLLDNETNMKVYHLQLDFQNKFMSLCDDFHNEYDKITKPTIEKINDLF